VPLPLRQLDAYLADVPGGLDAYPQFVQKASIYRQAFSRRLAADLAPRLPLRLAKLMLEPLPVSAWIPEVEGNALMLAIYEHQGYDEAAWVANGIVIARKLFQGPLYRALMMLVSPVAIMNRAQSRWEALHRGIELHAKITGDARAEIRVNYPPRLVPRLAAVTYLTAFQAALEAAGGRDVVCNIASYDAQEAVYDITWGGPRSSRRGL